MKAVKKLFDFCSIMVVMLTLSFGSLGVMAKDSGAKGYSASTEKRHYSDSDYAESGSDSQWMDWLMLIATSLIGARLMVKCKPMPMDVMAASAAAAIEIAGEVTEMIASGDGLESLDMDYRQGDLTDQQRDALIKQRDSYGDLIETLETKQMFQYAAAAAYGVAAGTAAFEYYQLEMAEGSCNLSASAAIHAACATQCTSATVGYAACVAGCEGNCQAALSAGIGVAEGCKATALAGGGGPSASALTTLNTCMETATTSKSACIAPAAVAEIQACDKAVLVDRTEMTTMCIALRSVVENGKLPNKAIFPNQQLFTRAMLAQQELRAAAPVVDRLKEAGFSQFTNFAFHPYLDSSQVNEDVLNQYIASREQLRLDQAGEVHSLTVDEFSMLQKMYEGFPQKERTSLMRIALNAGIDLVIPQAQAMDWLKALKIVGPAVAAYMLAHTTLASFIDQYIMFPGSRGLVWAMMAAKTYMSASTIDQQIDELYNRIDRVNDILTALGVHINEDHFQQGRRNHGNKASTLDNSQGPVKRPNFKDQLCVEDKNGKCINLSAQLKKSQSKWKKNGHDKGFKSLEQMQALTSMVADQIAVESKEGKLSEGTLKHLKELAGQGAAAKDLMKKNLNAVNNLRKKQGQKPLDFNKMQSDMSNKMHASLLKSIRDKGMTPKQLMHSMFPGRKFAADKLGKKDKAGKRKKSTEKVVKITGKKAPAKKKKKMLGLDELKDDELETIDDKGNGEVSSADELAKLDYNVEDIVKDKDVSIFTVLTSRYFNSAYPRFFKKKKKKSLQIEDKK